MEATKDEMAQARLWLDLHLPGPAAALPFSFLLDGRGASDLILDWTVERTVREPDRRRLEHAIAFADPRSGLEVRWIATEYRDFPAVESTLFFRNGGARDSALLSEIQPLDTRLPVVDGKCILHHSRGAQTGLADFEPLRRVLGIPTSTLRLTAGGGRSSSEYLPFFTMETAGSGAVVGIGWTGEWAARFTRDVDTLRVQAGMDLTRFRLHPGEEVRSPLVALLFWNDDRLRGHNLLRRFILEHHTPRGGAPGAGQGGGPADGKPLSVPVLCPSWGSTPFAVHEQNIRTIIAKGLPIDFYWIDAEWFGASPWWKNTGNWVVRPDIYPRGLKPLSDLLHASGRKLMLWFEPHRVSRGTAWQRDHEDWLLRVRPGDECLSWPHWVDMDDPRWREKESNRNQIADGDALLNIGLPEARRFLTDSICRIIEESGIDCYREDFNIAPLAFWRAADAPDRQGITEIRWVEGLYAFWDELRARNPGLVIDNCASGGRRIDLETLGRAIPFWRTDFPSDALAAQCQAQGLLPWVPLHSVGPARIGLDDPYRFRSMMGSSLLAFFEVKGDGPDLDPIPDSYPFELARRNLEDYRKIQHFFFGDYYPLTDYSPCDDAWMAYQLDRPDLGEGLIAVFKRPRSPFTSASFRLHGLDEAAAYEVIDLDTGETVAAAGAELASDGLTVALAGSPDSSLLRYRRAGRKE